MKRHLLSVFLLAIFPLAACAQQQRIDMSAFYSKEEAPHLEYVLPNPPGLDDPQFVYDLSQYEWGKSIRNTERGQIAVKDAGVNAAYFMERYSPALGHAVTPENNPKLYQLLFRTHMTEMNAGAGAKAYFKRVRPYQQYKEPTGLPSSENPTDFTSYPSGHTHISWAAGLILTAIDPDHTAEIMKIAYELGQSRVILGYHYQSDVEAGRLAGSITFARLCAMPEFLDLLAEAKAEFNNSKTKTMNFSELAKERYSCKKFDSAQISKEQLDAILEAGRVAPTAKNLQEQHIYVIQSEEALAKIDKNTPCRYGAPTVLVVAFDKNNVFTYPGGKRDSGVEDATIVATHMMLAAESVGVNSCWINYFDPDKLAASLGLPENEDILMILDLGFAADGAGPLKNHFSRKPLSDTVTYL